MIESISHITFIVRDLERTSVLLREIFDATEIYDLARKRFRCPGRNFF